MMKHLMCTVIAQHPLPLSPDNFKLAGLPTTFRVRNTVTVAASVAGAKCFLCTSAAA